MNRKTLTLFFILFVFAASYLPFTRVRAQGRILCPTLRDQKPLLVSILTRSELGFTEGLLWHDGSLYESTGAFGGASTINRINVETGTVSSLATTPNGAFGEGMTIFKNQFVQLTWKDHLAFSYSPAMELENILPFPQEGWGLTHSESDLVFSNGTDQISFADPSNLQIRRSIYVHDRDGNSYSHLNSLADVNSAIYINVFQSDQILKVDSNTGCVLTRYDLSSLRSSFDPRDRSQVEKDPSNDVFNGIAFDPDDGTFYLAGKNWWKIFKVKLGD